MSASPTAGARFVSQPNGSGARFYSRRAPPQLLAQLASSSNDIKDFTAEREQRQLLELQQQLDQKAVKATRKRGRRSAVSKSAAVKLEIGDDFGLDFDGAGVGMMPIDQTFDSLDLVHKFNDQLQNGTSPVLFAISATPAADASRKELDNDHEENFGFGRASDLDLIKSSTNSNKTVTGTPPNVTYPNQPLRGIDIAIQKCEEELDDFLHKSNQWLVQAGRSPSQSQRSQTSQQSNKESQCSQSRASTAPSGESKSSESSGSRSVSFASGPSSQLSTTPPLAAVNSYPLAVPIIDMTALKDNLEKEFQDLKEFYGNGFRPNGKSPEAKDYRIRKCKSLQEREQKQTEKCLELDLDLELHFDLDQEYKALERDVAHWRDSDKPCVQPFSVTSVSPSSPSISRPAAGALTGSELVGKSLALRDTCGFSEEEICTLAFKFRNQDVFDDGLLSYCALREAVGGRNRKGGQPDDTHGATVKEAFDRTRQLKMSYAGDLYDFQFFVALMRQVEEVLNEER